MNLGVFFYDNWQKSKIDAFFCVTDGETLVHIRRV